MLHVVKWILVIECIFGTFNQIYKEKIFSLWKESIINDQLSDFSGSTNNAYIKTIVLQEQNCADIQWIILIVQCVIYQNLYQSIGHWNCLTVEITILFDVDYIEC